MNLMLAIPQTIDRIIVITEIFLHSFLRKNKAIPIPIPVAKNDSLKPKVIIKNKKYNFGLFRGSL